ncbi:hypothetical protein EVAR_17247_1 [Eumeta japonica]|uniref:Uncharacterized protein n=1 Tax=Eumeta variegata TaxID=151549 RepID=A0A4C1TSX8_EUMVA|nr:hypothetical protein EVAR_17247_1 [Eumeta japonica]
MYETAAVKLVTKASQWRKIGKREIRKTGWGAQNLRITTFARTSGRQSFVLYIYKRAPSARGARGREPPVVAFSKHFARCCGWESLMKSVTLGNVTMSHRTREARRMPCSLPLNYDRSAARS